MIKHIKKIFHKSKEPVLQTDPPGRTFNRILTGRYFGCEDPNAHAVQHSEAKQDKIDQIKEHELAPKYVKYTYSTTDDKKVISAHVAFQKEVFAKKWNMVHVSEISFTVHAEEFDEFETMSGTQLKKDFRDVTKSAESFSGKERRKKKREY